MNLSEQVSRIKSMMGLISEQEEYASFLKQGFKNCRGITLTASDDDGGSSVGISRRELRNIDRETKKENKKEWKDFLSENGISDKDLDFDFYLRIKDIFERVRGLDGAGYYRKIFNQEGKPFNPDMTQKIANAIQSLFKDDSIYYFYWKDVLGNKPPSILEMYQFLKNSGGKSKLDELDNTNYDYKKYKQLFLTTVESFENKLKEKFPFEKPSGKTNFYFVWREGNSDKFRFFNTYEEWKLSISILKQEGITSSGVEEDGNASYASVRFSSKPTQGVSGQLFK